MRAEYVAKGNRTAMLGEVEDEIAAIERAARGGDAQER